MPKVIEDTLSDTINFAISTNTKSTYNTAVNMLNKCKEELKENMSLPLEERDILIFVGFCINRDNKVGTVKSYLAGLKKYHMALGFPKFEYMTPIIKEVLEGHENKVNSRVTPVGGGLVKKFRLPCTLNILKLIKIELKMSTLDPQEKIVTWAACTLAFYGALRGSEVLCDDKNEYCPNDILQKRDVKICKADSTGKESVTLKIRNSKTSRGRAEIVSVYANYGDTCPVGAVRKLQKLTKDCPQDAPAMCDKLGRVLTKNRLNCILNLLMGDTFPEGSLSCHSFRAGLISMFANMGHSDRDLAAIGRWSSGAYQEYIKLNRSKRHEMTVAASCLE